MTSKQIIEYERLKKCRDDLRYLQRLISGSCYIERKCSIFGFSNAQHEDYFWLNALDAKTYDAIKSAISEIVEARLKEIGHEIEEL